MQNVQLDSVQSGIVYAALWEYIHKMERITDAARRAEERARKRAENAVKYASEARSLVQKF